jgi:hypothetical protein
MMAPFLAPFRSAVKVPVGKYRDHRNKKPQSNQRSGVLLGTAWEGLEQGHMWSIITWKSHLSPRRITLRPRWHPPSPVKGPSIGNPPTFIGGARCTFVTWPNTEQDRSQCSRTARHVQRCSRDHLAVDLWASGDDQTADLSPTDPTLVRRDQPIARGTPLRLPHSAPASVDTRSRRSPRKSPRILPLVALSAPGTCPGAA